MSLHTCDLLVLGVLKQYSDRIIQKPYILDMLLDTYNTPEIKSLFKDSQKYINEAKEIILRQKLTYRLPFQTNTVDDYSVIALFAGHESDKFLHDYGHTQVVSQEKNQVKRIVNIKSVDSNTNSLNSITCIRRGIVLKNSHNPKWSSEVLDLIDYGETHTRETRYKVFLQSLPCVNNNPVSTGYYIQDKDIFKKQQIHKSVDDVNVTLLLNTKGSFNVHHVISQYFRYLIKTSRQLLSSRGFQEMTMQYSEIQNVSYSQGEMPRFQTQFHLSGKAHDDWLFDESMVLDFVNLSANSEEQLDEESDK